MGRILTWAVFIILGIGGIIALYFLITWLRGGRDVTETPVGEEVTLVCSAECANRGHCGTLQDGLETAVVLGGRERPIVAVEQQNVFFNENTTVSVAAREQRQVQEPQGDPWDATFFLVEQRNDNNEVVKNGWVPAWCARR